jgi:hypothetical protein
MSSFAVTLDNIQTTADALDITALDSSGIVAPGVVLFSGFGIGVRASGTDDSIVNHGQIYSASITDGLDAGLRFDAANGSVANSTGGEIFGEMFGVDFEANGRATVNNFGKIIGAYNNGVTSDYNSDGLFLNNHGYIYGGTVGVQDGNSSSEAGGAINNHGIIKSDVYAIAIDTAVTSLTKIYNAPGAVIEAPSKWWGEAIVAQSGEFVLDNRGTINGSVTDDWTGHNVIDNHGRIFGSVFLNNHDLFNGTGGTLLSSSGSGPGAITLAGSRDHVILGGGNLSVDDLGGNNTIAAGTSADSFNFAYAPNGSVDKITHFHHHLDKIELSSFVYSGLGSVGPLAAADFHVNHAVGSNAQIVYTPGNGFLYYDQDGSIGLQTHFATLGHHATLTHSDLFVL